MCGRFVSDITPQQLVELFGLQEVPRLEPRYNLAPSQLAPVVRNQGDHNRLDLLKWGLVPAWAKDPGIGNQMINARAESVTEKPAFRHALKYRRCIVPVSGFYEWQLDGEHHKQPWLIRQIDYAPLCLAGLWEAWQAKDGTLLETFTILTTTASPPLAKIHERMPVILQPDHLNLWLSHNMHDPELLEPLYQAYPAASLTACKVSDLVSSPHNDSPACCEPL